jgi:nucleoside-diphosphate-sugar epimerase
METVLVAGSSGRVGRAAVAELLRRGHVVRGLDRVPSDGLPATVIADLCDRAALDRVMTGVTCLVHLAATPDDDDFLTQLLPNNLVGLHHVMESARLAGVRRIVLASSVQVNWWQHERGPYPIRESDPVSPKGWYAATKMFLEAIGRGFTELHGLSVIVARLGGCPRPGQEAMVAASPALQDIYFSPGDIGRFLACCVEAPPEVRFLTVAGTSHPVQTAHFDLTVAETVLGYRPRDRWPEGM